jgi:hypothetical protein
MHNRLIEELREFELQLANLAAEERTPALKSMLQILSTLRNEHIEILGQIDQVLRRINDQLAQNSPPPFVNGGRTENSPVENNFSFNNVCGKEETEKENDLLNKINRLVGQLDDPKQHDRSSVAASFDKNGQLASSEISTMAYLAKYNLCEGNIKKPQAIIEKTKPERIFKAPPGKLF